MTNPDPPKPLDYHRDASPSMAHRGGLAVSFATGVGMGIATVVVAGVMGVAMVDAFRSPRAGTAVVAGGFALAAVGCVAAAVVHIRRGRRLSVEWRATVGRFWLLGFFIGCGVTTLIEGVCFGVGGPPTG